MNSRIPFADPDKLQPETRNALEGTPDLSIFKTLANAEAAFPTFIAFLASLWDESDLSPRHRELAILTVASSLGSEYEWSQHIEVAKLCEISEDEIAWIERLELERFEDTESELLTLVAQTVGPDATDAELFGRVREDLGDRRIAELILVATTYAGIAGVIEAFGLEVDRHRGVGDLELGEEGPKLGS